MPNDIKTEDFKMADQVQTVIERVNALPDEAGIWLGDDPFCDGEDLKSLTAEIARKDEALAEYEAMLADVRRIEFRDGQSIARIHFKGDTPYWIWHEDAPDYNTALDAYKALAALKGE